MTRDRPSFSGVIHRASLPAFRENFGEDFDKNLRGRAVELEGIVSTYGESLQIVLSRPQQLRLTDPAIMHQDRSLRTISSSDLAGLEQAEGDIVFIRGHVRSVSTSPQHATFINLDEAFSAIIRAANLRVIQRVWGEDLSARLSGQEIKLVGKVYRHTGGWGIALERPEQIIFDPSAKSL